MIKFLVEARIDKLEVKTQFFEIFSDFQIIDASDEKDAYSKYVGYWTDRCNEFTAYWPQVHTIQPFTAKINAE